MVTMVFSKLLETNVQYLYEYVSIFVLFGEKSTFFLPGKTL